MNPQETEALSVTQADREAAASIAVLVEMRDLIRAGKADHHAEPFARHRIAHTTPGDAEVRKALEPFAAYADPRRMMPASMPITAGSAMAKKQLTMGDCYAAAAALATPSGRAQGEVDNG